MTEILYVTVQTKKEYEKLLFNTMRRVELETTRMATTNNYLEELRASRLERYNKSSFFSKLFTQNPNNKFDYHWIWLLSSHTETLEYLNETIELLTQGLDNEDFVALTVDATLYHPPEEEQN